MRRKLRPALSLVLGSLFVSSLSRAIDLPELAAATKPSVVLITTYEGAQKVSSGTGFFVSTTGRIVTNHHLLEGAKRATATLSNGSELSIKGVLEDDPKHGLAILQADSVSNPMLKLDESSTLRKEDEIAIVGSPLGLTVALSAGIVSSLREDGLVRHDVLTENEQETRRGWGLSIMTTISQGSIGSPILNAKGDVVGVVRRLDGGDDVNFYVPVRFVREALARVPEGAKAKPLPLGGGERTVITNLLISGALFLVPYLAYSISRRRKTKPLRVIN